VPRASSDIYCPAHHLGTAAAPLRANSYTVLYKSTTLSPKQTLSLPRVQHLLLLRPPLLPLLPPLPCCRPRGVPPRHQARRRQQHVRARHVVALVGRAGEPGPQLPPAAGRGRARSVPGARVLLASSAAAVIGLHPAEGVGSTRAPTLAPGPHTAAAAVQAARMQRQPSTAAAQRQGAGFSRPSPRQPPAAA
jgi:hypothetical protein